MLRKQQLEDFFFSVTTVFHDFSNWFIEALSRLELHHTGNYIYSVMCKRRIHLYLFELTMLFVNVLNE